MTTVQVDLEDGFWQDAVELLEGEQRLALLDAVTTRPQIGMAEQVTVDVPTGGSLTVRRGDDRLDVVIDPQQPYVGVSVVADRLVARASASPFPRA